MGTDLIGMLEANLRQVTDAYVALRQEQTKAKAEQAKIKRQIDLMQELLDSEKGT